MHCKGYGCQEDCNYYRRKEKYREELERAISNLETFPPWLRGDHWDYQMRELKDALDALQPSEASRQGNLIMDMAAVETKLTNIRVKIDRGHKHLEGVLKQQEDLAKKIEEAEKEGEADRERQIEFEDERDELMAQLEAARVVPGLPLDHHEQMVGLTDAWQCPAAAG